MHHIIRIIVKANDKAEAREAAGQCVEDLAERGEIDYGTFFDENSPVSGKGRYGSMPVASKLDSKAGMNLLLQGMAAHRRDCLRALEKVREMVNNNTDEELFKKGTMDLYYFRMVGRREFVYLEDSSQIDNPNMLNDFLHKEDHNKLWIVPVDVHT